MAGTKAVVRRCAAVLALALAGVLAAPVSAQAEGPSLYPVNRLVSGPFDGTTTFEFGAKGCPFVHQVFDLTISAVAGGTSELDLVGCVDPGPGDTFVYTANFSLVAPRGNLLRGTATGTMFTLELTLTVTSAEGPRFHGVSGTIGLSGVWSGSGPDSSATGTLTGALVKSRT